jgi:hypothetical protein
LSNFLHGDFGHLRRLNLQYKPFQSIPSLIHIYMLHFMSWSYKFFKIKNSAKLFSCNPPCTNFLSRLWLRDLWSCHKHALKGGWIVKICPLFWILGLGLSLWDCIICVIIWRWNYLGKQNCKQSSINY